MHKSPLIENGLYIPDGSLTTRVKQRFRGELATRILLTDAEWQNHAPLKLPCGKAGSSESVRRFSVRQSGSGPE